MFGLSLSKILALVGVILTVWAVYKWISRAQAARPVRERPRDEPRRPEAIRTEDLVPCAGCGAYVPARGARGCGRPACPCPG